MENIANLINEDYLSYRASVAVVMDNNTKFLLGISTNGDDRNGKLCFPGGHINKNENPEQAAVRECYEETGIKCEPYRDIIVLGNKPDVAFVPCLKTGGELKPNREFKILGWYYSEDIRNMGDMVHNDCHIIIENLIF